MASGWAFLAGAANAAGGFLQNKLEMEQKQKLLQMQEDAQMKRDIFLKEYEHKLDDANKAKDEERTKNDVVDTFTNPETGDVLGRTKGGGTVTLSETSQDFKDTLAKAKRDKILKDQADLENAQFQPRLNKARLAEIEANTEKAKRDKPPSDKDAMADKIRSAYLDFQKSQGEKLKEDPNYQIPIDPSNPDGGSAPDYNKIDQTIRSQLYPVFGGDNVEAALGTNAGVGQTAKPSTGAASIPSQAPQSASPSKAPFPEGTKLKGPDGRMYVVKNGKPVLIG